jgi:hypothetical protein
MSLTDIASLASILSSLAVVASLIYVALQVQQNTKHTRATIHQGRVARAVDLAVQASDAQFVEAGLIAEGREPTLDAVRERQFFFITNAFIMSFEESYSQYRNGLLEEEAFQRLRRNVASQLSRSAFRNVWGMQKIDGSPFTKFVDDIIAEQSATVTLSPEQP